MRRISHALVEHGRATEWLTSGVLLTFGLTLALPGDTMAAPTFHVLAGLGMDDASLSAPLTLVGTSRLAALYINGSWKRSPMLRMVGAIIGAGVFGFLAVAFVLPMVVEGVPPSTGPGTYLVLALFDALAAHRSGADVRLAATPRL